MIALQPYQSKKASSKARHPGIKVILEVTGNLATGVRHAVLCCKHKKHVVVIKVEADVLAGPLLTRKAQEAGIVYSITYGD